MSIFPISVVQIETQMLPVYCDLNVHQMVNLALDFKETFKKPFST